MKLDKSYYKNAVNIISPIMARSANYSIMVGESGDDFNMPPPLEVIRFIEDLSSLEARESISKRCVIGKTVQVFLDDEKIGGFVMTKLENKFDSHDVFVNHPMALLLLMELCAAFVLKKSNPLHKEITEEAAVVKTP